MKAGILLISVLLVGAACQPQGEGLSSGHEPGPSEVERLYRLGRSQFEEGSYSAAIVTFEKAAEMAGNQQDRHYEGLLFRAMADTYNRTYNAREDSLYLLKALNSFTASGDSAHVLETKLRLAAAFCNDKRWDKARTLFKEIEPAVDPFPVLSRRFWIVYGSFLLDAPYPSDPSALERFQEAMTQENFLLDEQRCDLGYAFYLDGAREKACHLWDSLERKHPEGLAQLDYRRYCVTKRQGDYAKALAYLERCSLYQDSLLRAQTSEVVCGAQRDYMKAVAGQERLLAERERDSRRLAVAGGLLLAVLLVLSALVIILDERARRMKDQQVLADSQRLVARLKESEHRHLNQIHALHRDVRNTRSSLEEVRSDYLFMLRSGYRRLGNLFEARHFAGSQNHYEKVLCQKVGEILKEIDGDRMGFRKLRKFIEDNLDKPISHLMEDIPDLKDVDIQLFCYLVIGYDASLISLLMGIDNLNTVYSRKNRLIGRIKKLPVSKARRYLDLVA